MTARWCTSRKKMLVIALMFVVCYSASVAKADQELNLTRGSLLLYLDKIYDQDHSNNLTRVCNERKYAFTVYYRMMYFKFCGDNNSNEFEQFCDNIELHYSDSSSSNILQAITHTANEEHLFGPGILSDHLWEAKLTCQSVRNYFDDKYAFGNASNANGTQRPRYTEWIIHTIPFCLSITCGFTADAYYNQTPGPSVDDCLPSSYQAAIFIVYFLDTLIIVGTLTANLLILFITPKTKIAATPHG